MTDPLEPVRRAYRYLAAYERRVLDAVDMSDELVRDLGFERYTPHRWRPLYTSFPSRGYAPAGWVWDQLPSLAMRYQWFSGEPNTAGSRWVLVDHIADTAFEAVRLASIEEPRPFDLPATSESRSILRWHVVTFRDALPDSTFGTWWNELLQKALAVSPEDILPAVPTPAPVQHTSPALNHSVHCVDLSTLVTESSLEDTFLAPLRTTLTAPAG